MMKLKNLNKLKKNSTYSTLLLNSTLIKKIPFLNILTDSKNNKKCTTSPYKKLTSYHSTLLNYHSECSQKYKVAIIKNLIHRAFYISSIFYKELTNIKQTLVNNFSYKLIDQQLKLYLHNIHKNNNTTNNNNTNRIKQF